MPRGPALPTVTKKAGFGLQKYAMGQKLQQEGGGGVASAGFQPSERFDEPRPGYVFSTGERSSRGLAIHGSG